MFNVVVGLRQGVEFQDIIKKINNARLTLSNLLRLVSPTGPVSLKAGGRGGPTSGSHDPSLLLFLSYQDLGIAIPGVTSITNNVFGKSFGCNVWNVPLTSRSEGPGRGGCLLTQNAIDISVMGNADCPGFLLKWKLNRTLDSEYTAESWDRIVGKLYLSQS